MLRKLVYVFLIIFFIISRVAIFTFVSGLNAARDSVVEPVGDLFRQLVIQATPVIVPDPAVIVQEVNKLARLETASVSLNKVITAERDQELLWGAFGESLIFIAYGEAVAGVDLARMRPEDIQVVDPDTVMVHLPQAELFNRGSMLNTEQSYIAHRDEGVFTDADPQLETTVRRTAETELEAAALEFGILEMADENAQEYLTQFLGGLGFEEVIFTDEVPPPVPTYEQPLPKGYVVTPAAP